MKEDLIKKAEIIIKELKLEDAKITDKWMAHYIAELIEEYESSSNDKEKLEIGKECGKLILVLWQLMLREKELEIERKLGKKEKKLNDDVEVLYPILKKSLNEPENVRNLENKEKIDLMQIISEVEYDLFYFYKVSKYFSQVANKEETFSPRDIDLFNYYKEQISIPFPFFEDLTVDNQKLVEEKIFSALGSLNYLRNLFFSLENMKSELVENLPTDSINKEESELMERFKKETGKNAIWGGKLTKAYKIWKNKQNL